MNNTMVIDTLGCNGLFPHQLGPQTLISNLVNHFSRAFGENEIPGLTLPENPILIYLCTNLIVGRWVGVEIKGTELKYLV